MKHLLLTVLMILPIFASSQDKKIEKEEDVDRDQMPAIAQQYLRINLPRDINKLRFYHETDGEKESYEAKFKFQGNRFSVEFNEMGHLEDIEVQIKKRNLDKQIINNIEYYLESQHDRYKIEKIQAQYLSPEKVDDVTMQRAKKIDDLKPDNYEIIVATKNQGKLKKFEMLFDPAGNFVNEREIIRNSYDYLIF